MIARRFVPGVVFTCSPFETSAGETFYSGTLAPIDAQTIVKSVLESPLRIRLRKSGLESVGCRVRAKAVELCVHRKVLAG